MTATVTKLQPKRCPSCGRTAKRSSEANRRYWAILHELSDRLKPNGQVFAALSWHEYFKQRFLGAVEMKLPNGKSIQIANSTADLDRGQFNDYCTQVEAFAAERGIYIEDDAA